jgi:hypothetical protein
VLVKFLLLGLVAAVVTSSPRQQPTSPIHDGHGGDLGTVDFATSCTPDAHAEFQRGVAMLHSYWFGYAGKTFRSVLEKDPECAIAYWGLALDLLGNTLAAPPSRQNADAAWKLLEQRARFPSKRIVRPHGWMQCVPITATTTPSQSSIAWSRITPR